MKKFIAATLLSLLALPAFAAGTNTASSVYNPGFMAAAEVAPEAMPIDSAVAPSPALAESGAESKKPKKSHNPLEGLTFNMGAL